MVRELSKERSSRRLGGLAAAQESAQYDPRSGKPRKTLEQILSRYRVLPNGCHEWTGAKNKDGYGIVCLMIDGKATTMGVHRLQRARHTGPLDPDKDTCHDCPGGDNRACINNDHLWDGTHGENLADTRAKGRANISGLKGQGATP